MQCCKSVQNITIIKSKSVNDIYCKWYFLKLNITCKYNI